MRDPLLDVAFFNNPLRLINTANNTAYAEYSLSQAKKYGIKGFKAPNLACCAEICAKSSRFWRPALSRIWMTLCAPVTANFAKTMANSLALAARCTSRACAHGRVFRSPGTRMLPAMEQEPMRRKGTMASITRLFSRPALPRPDGGAFRYGQDRLPLATRGKASSASSEAKYPWPELEQVILARLAEVDAKRANAPYVGVYDEAFCQKILLDCYGRGRNGGTIRRRGGRNQEKKLLEMEHGHNVKIVYATEAGSRA